MKSIHLFLQGVTRPVMATVFALGASNSLAQSTGEIPVVTVQATQPFASSLNPGVFTVYRAGNTNLTLNVWYDLGGTASNGVDYALIPPHLVQIAAGVTSNTIVITPSNTLAGNANGTVVLSLTNSPLLNPVNYEIGSPSAATISIDTAFFIYSPANGAVFYQPADIQISAEVRGVAGMANSVEFFAGTNDLGRGMAGASAGLLGTPFFLTWTNPPAGDFALTAVASGNSGVYGNGNSLTSAPVNISVLPASAQTNLLSIVNIFAPANGSVFYSPTNIQIFARATDPDGSVTNVEFFAGGTDLGRANALVLDPPGVNGVVGLVYYFNWINPSPGAYPLTAVATDDGGASTVSAPVNIAVRAGSPTNIPPVVRITSPAGGATFFAPVNIPLYAFASDADGSVVSVQFFNGSNSLGYGRSLPVVRPLADGTIVLGGPVPPIYPTNLFFLIWSNAPVGSNVVTAQATDNGGATTVSAPVAITVLVPPPPPTNKPAIVTVVATDPIAIEGTNCWVWPGETNAAPTWAAWPPSLGRLFTNCGPKTATFTVRRFGDTNRDLVVMYSLGGTASNGVDYVALPTSLTIPAGQRRALIPIVPIDDGPPDFNKTVHLTIEPSTNTPADYMPGFPSRAAAMILDGGGPRPLAGMLPGGCFHLTSPGPDAAWFYIEYSTDMTHWTAICTNQVVNGSIDFVDPESPANPARFYRAMPLANPPPD
jgi:hypothetical protein